jgi:thioesterase domain-containing protein/acyl carrier protein
VRENGEFEFMGRIDDQIKIRGHRIEVAEVREAILSHGTVKEVALLVREDEPGDRRLVAYVTLRHPLPSAEESVRMHAKTKLPSYMVPAAFVILDKLPVNTNGKVDRKALPPPSTRPEMAKGYCAPRNPLEQLLSRVWRELLGVDRVGVNDNFFDLGGHSLLAARLIAQIEKETGQNIPVATLFGAPTIAELARKIDDHSYANAWAPLVELRSPTAEPEGAPFFCIHSLGANLVSFHKLATLLRPDRAVYGLQPHGLDGKQKPLDNLEAMAAAYLEEIRKKQPDGPYYLGGICLGGVVAYEVARRLEAAGQEVRLLALIDSFMPSEPQYLHVRSTTAEYLDFHLGEILLLSGFARWKYVAHWLGNGFVRLGRALGLGSRDSVTRATRHVAQANVKAMLGYTPGRYGGRITQMMCSDWAERSYEDRRLAWSSVAEGGLEVHIVPGNHLTMVEEPHVQVLALELQRALDRAGATRDNTALREKGARRTAKLCAAA